jgi:flavin reductase (DIM6/NTAB) family NADH-FMN oxidoreductase RutF
MKVDTPLIKECYANFECRLYDGSQISKQSVFIREVGKAHIATFDILRKVAQLSFHPVTCASFYWAGNNPTA